MDDDHKGAQGDQGPQGPSGPQGVIGEGGAVGATGDEGERGLTGETGQAGHVGARGEPGKAGSRMKVPRRIFAAFVALALANAAAFYVALEDRTHNIDRINDGRRAGVAITCAFGGAVAEQGKKVISTARPDASLAERALRRGLGRGYVEGIARSVEKETGVRGLVIRHGREAGRLDCDKLEREVVKPRASPLSSLVP